MSPTVGTNIVIASPVDALTVRIWAMTASAASPLSIQLGQTTRGLSAETVAFIQPRAPLIVAGETSLTP